MANKVLVVKKISFTQDYIRKLKRILSLHQPITFLRGVPIKALGLIPKQYSESGFLVFQSNKRQQPTIIKIVWDHQFQFRYQAEFFVYQSLAKHKGISPLIPKLLAKNDQPPSYFEIEYLDKFEPLGDDHQTLTKLNDLLIDQIIEGLFKFHQLKVAPQSYLHQQRTSDFYREKLVNLNTGRSIIKFFGSKIRTKLLDFLLKNRAAFLPVNLFILGDRNPSNIFINKNRRSLKFIDFDRIGFGNPALDYPYFHLTLSHQPQPLSHLLQRLDQQYKNVPSFWHRYWYDLLIRCADEMQYWEIKNNRQLNLLKSIFQETLLKLN